jgi:hypothetical protein
MFFFVYKLHGPSYKSKMTPITTELHWMNHVPLDQTGRNNCFVTGVTMAMIRILWSVRFPSRQQNDVIINIVTRVLKELFAAHILYVCHLCNRCISFKCKNMKTHACTRNQQAT